MVSWISSISFFTGFSIFCHIAEEFRFHVYPLNHLVGVVYPRAINYKKKLSYFIFKNLAHHGNTEMHLHTNFTTMVCKFEK